MEIPVKVKYLTSPGTATAAEHRIKAQQNPEDYGHRIIRITGFSARFVILSKSIPDDILPPVELEQSILFLPFWTAKKRGQ